MGHVWLLNWTGKILSKGNPNLVSPAGAEFRVWGESNVCTQVQDWNPERKRLLPSSHLLEEPVQIKEVIMFCPLPGILPLVCLHTVGPWISLLWIRGSPWEGLCLNASLYTCYHTVNNQKMFTRSNEWATHAPDMPMPVVLPTVRQDSYVACCLRADLCGI